MKIRPVRKKICVLLTSALFFFTVSAAAAEGGHETSKQAAVGYLKTAVGTACPIATYETDDPLLSVTSSTYDSAIAALALMSEGDYGNAAVILDAFVTSMKKDAEHKDRFRNAYMAGNPSELPGYWNDEAGQWIQDAYQVGTGTKSSCAACYALLMLYEETGNEEYLNTAVAGLDWIIDNCDDGNPGFTSGYTGWEGSETYAELTYKSTADNLWMAAACERAAAATEWGKYEEAAAKARGFVTENMYSGSDSRFFQGTQDDGVTPSANLVLCEVQALAQLCINDDSGMDNIEKCLAQDGGYAYSNADVSGSWVEGSAMAALALKETGDEEAAENAITAMEELQTSSGSFMQASVPGLQTGEKDRMINDLPSVGACAWFILAVNGWNPFS